ncbi:hypothetical protein BCR42DRAFT_440359 [Absidia repens]|uniref:Uncharacterized protein n=1 Tax=Absidia repens TaxID=90262 RepID=A0A1X2I932_9FUNG|nr:hypothetical protein BCR42DRAFT_440359 [Absidia repens]
MPSDGSDNDNIPLTVNTWGEQEQHQQDQQQQQQQEQQLTTWGQRYGWKNVSIPNNIVNEGCKYSGGIYRTGKNYKPIDEESLLQQRNQGTATLKTGTTQSSADRNTGNDRTGRNSSRRNNSNSNNNDTGSRHEPWPSTSSLSPKTDSAAHSPQYRTRYGDRTPKSGQEPLSDYRITSMEPPSLQPTSINQYQATSTTTTIKLPPLSEAPENATYAYSLIGEPSSEKVNKVTSADNTYAAPDPHHCNASKQASEPGEYCDSIWATWVNEISSNKNTIIPAGFDSNYVQQLCDKTRPPNILIQSDDGVLEQRSNNPITIVEPPGYLSDLPITIHPSSSSSSSSSSSASSASSSSLASTQFVNTSSTHHSWGTSEDDDVLWNNIKLSMELEISKQQGSNGSTKVMDWVSGWDDILPSSPSSSSSTLTNNNSNSNSNSNSNNHHQHRFAHRSRERYSTIYRPLPRNYYMQNGISRPAFMTAPSKTAAPPPSHNPIVVSIQLECRENGTKTSIPLRKLDDPVVVARSFCQTHHIVNPAHINDLTRLFTNQKSAATQRHHKRPSS